jgi:dolichol-phosphate mannosyltransferase
MIVILLPAYKEENSLPSLMPKLKTALEQLSEGYKVLVCNDGSRDRTQDMLEKYAESMPIEIIHHKINRGLGETSRDLFERAAEICEDEDVIIRLDCDDTHEPEFIPTLIEKLRSGYDVVIASRFEPGGGQLGVNAYRAVISRLANYFMKVFFPIPGLKEYSCGFRAYRAKKIKQAIDFYGNNFIQLKGLGFTCTLEKLVKLKIIGATFGEVPFVLRYDQKRSSSKMVSSITTYGYFTMALLYHWPWGGWRRAYKRKYHAYDKASGHLSESYN